MSNRTWSLLVCSTAIVTVISFGARADDVYMVPLARPTVESVATDQFLNTPAPTPLDAVEVRKAPSPKVFVADEAMRQPSPVPDQTASAPESPETAPPAASSIAIGGEPKQPAPAEIATKATISADEPSELGAITASVGPNSPDASAQQPPVAATRVAEPSGSAVLNAQAVNSAPAASLPPIQVEPSAALVQPAAVAPIPAVNSATTAPVAATAPTAPAGPSVTADMIAAALKSEIETRFAAKTDDHRLSAEERKSHAAIIAYYTSRNFQPLWVDANGLDKSARDAMDRLARAQEDGLNPADYPAPKVSGDLTAVNLAKAEVALTESVLKYARQAQAGRFEPSRLGELVTPKLTFPDPESVLKSLATASDTSQALQAFNPPQEGYRRLKTKLAELDLGKSLVPQARVPAGPTIRPGEKDTRVALLRDRLGVSGATANDASLYDDGLVDAVKSFQKKNGLKPSGLIGQQTVDLVNDASPGQDTRAADIIANMERWRWLPRNLGELHVMVNIPDFALTVVRDGAITHRAKAIVGRVANPTPVFSDTMTHIIVNPYWNVPYSIVKKEYLGKAQETKGEALTRGNFEVSVNDHTVDPATVDWNTVNAAQVHLRQRPGEGNALGNVKFMFPNQHSVYIHDTSSRGLFVQSYRSLSHGCVRVQDPFSFADALLAEEPTGINGSKLKSTIGGDEKYFWLKKTIPVHIAYFTAFVDDAGLLQTRPDLYGINAKTKQLLGL